MLGVALASPSISPVRTPSPSAVLRGLTAMGLDRWAAAGPPARLGVADELTIGSLTIDDWLVCGCPVELAVKGRPRGRGPQGHPLAFLPFDFAA